MESCIETKSNLLDETRLLLFWDYVAKTPSEKWTLPIFENDPLDPVVAFPLDIKEFGVLPKSLFALPELANYLTWSFSFHFTIEPNEKVVYNIARLFFTSEGRGLEKAFISSRAFDHFSSEETDKYFRLLHAIQMEDDTFHIYIGDYKEENGFVSYHTNPQLNINYVGLFMQIMAENFGNCRDFRKKMESSFFRIDWFYNTHEPISFLSFKELCSLKDTKITFRTVFGFKHPPPEIERKSRGPEDKKLVRIQQYKDMTRTMVDKKKEKMKYNKEMRSRYLNKKRSSNLLNILYS